MLCVHPVVDRIPVGGRRDCDIERSLVDAREYLGGVAAYYAPGLQRDPADVGLKKPLVLINTICITITIKAIIGSF